MKNSSHIVFATALIVSSFITLSVGAVELNSLDKERQSVAYSLKDFAAGKAVSARQPHEQELATTVAPSAELVLSERFQQFDHSFRSIVEGDSESQESLLDKATAFFKTAPNTAVAEQSYVQLKAQHLLYLARFDSVEQKLDSLGLSHVYGSKLVRAKAEYLDTTSDLFERFDAHFNAQKNPLVERESLFTTIQKQGDLRSLLAELDRVLALNSAIEPRILRNDALPYKSISLAPRVLVSEPQIVPSYASPDQVEASADDTNTESLSEAVLQKAKELEYDPIKIFEFVNSSIDTELYAGTMKGSAGTLAQGAGNSVDQAALLVDLFRASTVPARYVSGVIEFDSQALKNLVGVDNESQAIVALRRAGIPVESIVEGGRINGAKIQHTWVSAQIPYANYRGATVDRTGKAWLPLMPSIKEYLTDNKGNIFDVGRLSAEQLQADVLATPDSLEVLPLIEQEFDEAIIRSGLGGTYQGRVSTRQLNVTNAGYVPNSLPVTVLAVTGEYPELPVELVHKVKFTALKNVDRNSEQVMQVTVPLADVINKDVTFSYQAATQESHQLALGMGGINNVPLYLLDLRPRVLVQGQVIDVADLTLPAGQEHRLIVEIISPAGNFVTDKVVYAGGYHAVALAAQDNGTSLQANQSTSYETQAGKILNQVAQRYIAEWAQGEQQLASITGRRIVSPLPTLVFASNDFELQALLGQPQFLRWRGVNIDAAFRVTETVQSHRRSIDSPSFVKLSALLGSQLEHEIFERYFGVASISADKGIALAQANSEVVLQLTSEDLLSLDSALSAHPAAVVESVRGWLNQQYVVTMPAAPISYFDWSGSVWLVEDPTTGHAGYFISRGLAGGATADALPQDLADALENFTIDEINTDPVSAAQVLLFAESDFQISIADAESEPLKVLVSDVLGRPVKGAVVNFSRASGVGMFSAEDGDGNSVTRESVSTATDARGFAQATYRSPRVIRENQIVTFLSPENDAQSSTEAALSYISISVDRGNIAPLVSSDFYTVITVPSDATQIEYVPDLGLGLEGSVNSVLAFEKVRVADEFGNRVANVDLDAETGDIRFNGDAFIVDQHKILTAECENNISACSNSVSLQTDIYGEAFVGIVFGRVDTSETSDVVVPAIYPIKISLDEDNSIELPYIARTESRTSSSGPGRYAAAALNETYRGSGSTQIFPREDETVESENVTLEGTGHSGLTTFSGQELVRYQDMRLGSLPEFYTPKVSWSVTTLDDDGNSETEVEEVSTPFPVAAVQIIPQLPEPIDLNLDLKHVQFNDFTYLSSPVDYEPFYAVMELYANDKVAATYVVNSQAGSLVNGRVTLPPVELKVGVAYQGQFVFNRGAEFDEVRSERFDVPITAPVIRNAGGAGAVIQDDINDASCVIREPEFRLNLVQEAIVTITTRSREDGVDFTFISERTLPAGDNIFNSDDIGFVRSFGNTGPTDFTVVARATSNGRVDRLDGRYYMSIQDVGNLPIGSPVYEDINLFRGSLSFSRNDVSVPGRGPNIEFTRSYSSSSSTVGDLGPGWSHNYDSFVQQTQCGWVTVSGGVAGGVTFFPDGEGEYQPGRGYHSTLRQSDGNWDFFAKDGTRYHYSERFDGELNPRIYLSYIEDTNGNRTSLGYNPGLTSGPQLEVIADSSGRRVLIEYSDLDTVIDADGPGPSDVPSTLLYPRPRKVISKLTGLDYQLNYRYDQLGRLNRVENNDLGNAQNSIVERYQYNELELLPPQVDQPPAYDLSKARAIAKIIDPRGVETEYEFERVTNNFTVRLGREERSIEVQNRTALVIEKNKLPNAELVGEAIAAQFVYAPRLSPRAPGQATVTDPRGVEYIYVMDGFGRNLSIEGPTGTKEMTWTEQDTLMLTSTDENSVLTTYEYDEFGNATREEVSGPGGETFTVISDFVTGKNGTIKNLLKSRIDRRGNQTNYDYDDNGNLIRVNHPVSEACPGPCSELFSYLPNGDRSSASDERSKTTFFSYDRYGNADLVRFPIGDTSAKFDQRSRRLEARDENGNVSRFEYDWVNRLTEQVNAEGGVRSFAYDDNSNKVEEVDEEGRRMEYGFDFDNRIVESATFGLNAEEIAKSFTYDPNDNLLSETDYRGNQTSHQYDDANRKIVTTLPANTQGKLRTFEYEYDSTSNIVRQTVSGDSELDQQVSLFDYDDLYRQTQITDPESGDTYIEYDGNGNIVQKIDELGRVMQYDYDEVNRKVAQRDAVGSSIEREMRWEYDRAGNLLRLIDARGNSERYIYDDRNRRISKTNFEQNRFAYRYDDYGNLREEFDHFGNRRAYEYDELHRRIKTTDQRGFESFTDYDLVGNPTSETQANGNVISRVFDFLNRPIAESDSIGALMAYSYDADSNKLSHTDGKGYLTTYDYDALSQMVAERQPENRTLLTEYDVYGNVSRLVDGEGNQTEFEYDRLNRQVLLRDADQQTIFTSYDAVDNKLGETDKRGNTTEYEYDQLNRVTKVTEPLAGNHDRIITNSYDPNDNLLQTIDKRGIASDYDYDKLNRVVEERRAGIVVVKNTYSEIGDLIGLEDANGNKTAMEFNERHEMVLESRPEIAITRYSYDEMGDVLTHTDPESRAMTYEYDLRRRKISSTNNDGETTTYGYDLNNNQVRKTRPLLNEWAYTYDELNRLVGIIDAESEQSSYAYDRQSNQVSHTDANGNVTQYEYDVLNRKSLKRYPLVAGQAPALCSYDYDPNNNLVRKEDANGQIDVHGYDALNRLTQTDYSNPSVTVGRDIQREVVAYDGNNNPIETTETYTLAGGGTEVRSDQQTYDDFDRLYSRTDSWGKTLNYRYDLNGNRTSLTDSDGINTTYVYDGLNRVNEVNTAQGRTDYLYDRSSLLKEVRYPNNTQAIYRYDPAKRIAEIQNRQNSAVVSDFQYQYDDNGNRIEQQETNGGAQEITTYQYDLNDRLTGVVYDTDTPEQNAVSYGYDAAYNRVSEIHSNASNETTVDKAYTYNARNQLTDIEDNLDGANNVSYQFDQNGNQIQKVKGSQTTSFVFDIRDDLRQVQTGGSTVGQFLYDAQGLRIEKLGERGAERSTYDGQSILQQYDQNNLTRAKFDYGPNKLLSLNATNEPTSFYLTDALQSVVNLTNDQGAIQARYQYDAWGIKRNEVGSSYNRFSFTGYEEDKETGLLYAKARYYDPDNGKFLSEDAYEGDFLMAPSLHRYLYAFQNPTVYTDPTGNIVCGGVCVGGVIVAGITAFDYFTSDRRERVREQIQPESFGGQLLSDSVALSQSASNTLSFGYFDAVQRQGNQGYVDHTKENILPINASKNAYKEFTSPDGDKIEGTLHVLKGLGQTASLGLGPVGLRNPSASASRNVADDIGPGGQQTKLVGESDDTVQPRGYVSGDPNALRNIVRDAKAGNTAKQGELEVIKELRARGQNVHAIDNTSALRKSEGTYNDIYYGGKRPLTPREATGTRGEIKTLQSAPLVENSAIQAVDKAAHKQLQPDGGTVFVNTKRTGASTEQLDDLSAKMKSGEGIDRSIPSNVEVEFIQ